VLKIIDEVQTIFDKVDSGIKSGVKEHDLYGHVDIAVGSIINNFLFGYRFHGDKEGEFADLKSRVQTHIVLSGHPLVMMSIAYPHFFKHLPFFKGSLLSLFELKLFREDRNCKEYW
jgi:hypothetical protein